MGKEKYYLIRKENRTKQKMKMKTEKEWDFPVLFYWKEFREKKDGRSICQGKLKDCKKN